MTQQTVPPQPSARGHGRWIEPDSRRSLRWGGYRPRLLVGIAAIAVGITLVQVTTAYSLEFLAWGTLLQGVGWVVIPTSGWRRLAAIFPAVGASCLLLAGGGYLGAFAVILWGWLLVRRRPGGTYLLLLVPIALGVSVSGLVPGGMVVEYEYAWVAYLVAALLTVACAWAARGYAAFRRVDEREARLETVADLRAPEREARLETHRPDIATGAPKTVSGTEDGIG
ncbi:hypothetical protein OSC27_13465 [Microbacterium sp. STN6]|uniref:hypothetical protein n=1 Tax=Microbacterium sp. STN6 TaxID=2995588 RepID=UPI002260D113|nr:hypothetical protein [Microbacterium sp. STN6]MCX7523281.1 hypothetical protein [Microbacterium sp. STN6]